MLETKFFHIGDILSVIEPTNRPLIDMPKMPDGTRPPKRRDYMSGVYEILSFMTGVDLNYSSELKNARSACLQQLEEKFPFLVGKKFDVSKTTILRCCIAFESDEKIINSIEGKVENFVKNFSEEKQNKIKDIFGSSRRIAENEVKHLVFKKMIDYEIYNATPYESWKKDLWESTYDNKFENFHRISYLKNGKKCGYLGSDFHKLDVKILEMKDKLSELVNRQIHESQKEFTNELVKEHGAYHPVTQLEYYENKDIIQNMKDNGFEGEVLNYSKKHNTLTPVLFNLSAEESRKIPKTEYEVLAQGVLAIANRNILIFTLNAEDIVQSGENLELNLNTANFEDAAEKYDSFKKIFPNNLLKDYVTLNKSDNSDHFVIRILASKIKDTPAEKNFIEYVNNELGILPDVEGLSGTKEIMDMIKDNFKNYNNAQPTIENQGEVEKICGTNKKIDR